MKPETFALEQLEGLARKNQFVASYGPKLVNADTSSMSGVIIALLQRNYFATVGGGAFYEFL
jgi:hypothetical protein